MSDPKHTLARYLQAHREALLWKLDGLGERDVRWPWTPSGTNLLGLVKHVGSMEFGYFGEVFDRPSGEPRPWLGPEAEVNDDMWATADQSLLKSLAIENGTISLKSLLLNQSYGSIPQMLIFIHLCISIIFVIYNRYSRAVSKYIESF